MVSGQQLRRTLSVKKYDLSSSRKLCVFQRCHIVNKVPWMGCDDKCK